MPLCYFYFAQQAEVITKSRAAIAMRKSSPHVSQLRVSQAHAQASVEMEGGNQREMSERADGIPRRNWKELPVEVWRASRAEVGVYGIGLRAQRL
jgi:hypothetical protein